MDYREATEYLNSLNSLGSILGLDTIRELLERLGNPQNQLKFVHIAGTNGKGSVSSLLASVLYEAGIIAGQYTSPAVKCELEIIKVEGGNISKEHFSRLINRIREVSRGMVNDHYPQPTRFEVETAAAFLYFREMECDLAIVECGLGGLLDATNVITTTECAVITSISMDHRDFLGDTLEEIARNKTGIIKPGCHVVTTDVNEAVLSIIQDAATEAQCQLTVADSKLLQNLRVNRLDHNLTFQYRDYKDLVIRMLGIYQVENAIIAMECLGVLYKRGYDISQEDIYRGLFNAKWDGRFQVIGTHPDFVLDGAHNEAAAKKLAECMDVYYPQGGLTFILGVFADKEYDKILRNTINHAAHIITIEKKDNPRALSAIDLAEYIRNEWKHEVQAADCIEDAVRVALDITKPDKAIIAFGSLSHLSDIEAAYRNATAAPVEIKKKR